MALLSVTSPPCQRAIAFANLDRQALRRILEEYEHLSLEQRLEYLQAKESSPFTVNDLNDPRVLFAAERTLLAWGRTAAGLMAIGFLIDRSSLVVAQGSAGRDWAFAIGIGFVLLGVVLSGLSVVQYRRALASLRPADIPAGYWVNLSVCATALVGLLGLALASYLALT